MKKFFLLFILSLISFQKISATHTKGGWMYYEYLGPGLTDPLKHRYKVGLNYYMDCNSGIIENIFTFTIYDGSPPFNFVQNVDAPILTNGDIQNCNQPTCYPCINIIPTICYKVIKYELIVELDSSPNGYIISKQRCCRINFISNLQPPSNSFGATYTIKIPGVNAGVPTSHINSSPKFIFNDTSIVCGDNLFSINFGATDTDGDSLKYSFCEALDGGSSFDPIPNPASAPPYSPVIYSFPFSGNQPLGAGAVINPVTGVISGTAPPPGEYVITICVEEFRNGIRFAETKKELHLKIADCSPVAATLDPNFTTCGDLTLSFNNQTDNMSIQNWYWEFGDPASGTNDTSLLQFPSHTFTTAGVYTIKLVVNKGLPCIDSTMQVVNVFPGFFPGFAPLAPFCAGKPVAFDDTTTTNHGIVSNWSWNFGDPATLADTSHVQNPTYSYAAPGNYTVKLIVGNSKGCVDSTTRDIVILPTPALSLFPRDTSYCGLDSIQLTATGSGTFNWFPNSSIIGGNTATPVVFPPAPTIYYVTLDVLGCQNTDSTLVIPVFDLTSSITANPPSICEGDTLTLTGSSNHTNIFWQWNPVVSLSSPNSSTTSAFPVTTTMYTLQTRWGNNCIATTSQNILVTPLAIPNAGPDTSYCQGQTGIPLNASGGNSYQWTPVAGLSDPTIANPIASPAFTTTYTVSVGVNGCSRRKSDSVTVTVRQKPPLGMPNDTLICIIDTLQLTASGLGNFLWSPAYNINTTTINNPLVSPDTSIMYHVRLTDIFNCFSDDSVFIEVKNGVTIDAGNDTSICRSEGFFLTTTGDALRYSWSPVLGLSNSLIKNPFVNPQTTTLYTVTGSIGKCVQSADVYIKVANIPVADAGNDQVVCIGFDSRLQANGGSIYEWSPIVNLSDPFISNPQVIQPIRNVRYVVTVSDTLGCPKKINDTVFVQVIRQLNVNAGPPDTSVVEGEPLLLSASGAVIYLWSPDTWLTDAFIQNTVSNPKDDILYRVTGMDASGCLGTDSIRVRLFKLDPDMYVPTAFTPNGDGNNDIIKPILLGMRSLNYFRVYNRFGQMVYSTREIGKGWNGIYGGKEQDMATFVWMAEGVTFKGQKKTKKGHVLLIR
ncbi:MAG: PKD domain-containing protein [Ferruginibacter sp.]